MGFIIQVSTSPRSLTVEAARPLVTQAAESAQTVAVVNTTDEEFLSNMCSALEPDYVQIQIESTPSRLLDLKEVLGVQVIGLVQATEGAVEKASALKDVVDMVVVDSAVDGISGGTGKTHDWALSRKIRDTIYPAKMMLAGGLNCDNVQSAIGAVMPSVVDVSSGVESGGWKSRELVSTFIRRAKEVSND